MGEVRKDEVGVGWVLVGNQALEDLVKVSDLVWAVMVNLLDHLGMYK